jgi:uncharacterized membrane protein
MRALIVVGFGDPFRASEVLNELQRRDWAWVADLDQAVVVRWNERDRLRVQLSIDPVTREAAAWAGLWGSFLRVALFVPITDGIAEAAGRMAIASRAQDKPESVGHSAIPTVRWWRENLRIPGQFLRDVGAMVQPGDSALLMLLRAPEPEVVLHQLRDYGGSLLHTLLSSEQEAELEDALAMKSGIRGS